MPLIIGFLTVLVAMYYATIVLHLFGVKIFSDSRIVLWKAFIPFYYWIVRKVNY